MVAALPGLLMVGEVSSTFSVANTLNDRSINNLGILAHEQSGGQGRRDHLWFSPPGGLYLSWCIEVKSIPRICTLSLLTAWKIREALQEKCPCEVSIKWPNDLLTEEKKLGGILIRANTTGQALTLTFGIGLNLQISNFPDQLAKRAISLHQLNIVPPTRQSLALDLIKRINPVLADPGAAFNALRPTIAKNLLPLGDSVQITTPSERIQGIASGLDALGGLIITLPDSTTQTLYEGSLSKQG